MRFMFAAFVLLLLAAAVETQAQTDCSTLSGRDTDCYSAPDDCHWDPVGNLCANGAASSCEEHYRDAATCTGACAINLFNSQCFLVPTTVANATADAITSSSTCVSSSFYYDQYAPSSVNMDGKCRFSLAESISLFPTCGTYNNYPAGVFADVCSGSRGCVALQGTSICVDMAGYGTQLNPTNHIQTTFVMQTVSPSLDPNTHWFTANQVIPFLQFLNVTEPLHHVLTVGLTSQLSRPLQPSVCNNLLVAQPVYGAGEPAINPPYTDTTGLYNGLLASTDLVFSSGDALATALYQAVGHVKIASDSVTPHVTVDATNVNEAWGFNVDWAVANCGATRTVVSSEETRYRTPLTMDVRSVNYEVSSTVFVDSSIYTYGTVTVGATAAAPLRVFLSAAVDTESGATIAGTKKRTFTVLITYRNQDPTTVVGLRSLADVSMVSTGGNTQTTPPTNCFGTHPVSVTPPAPVAVQCTDMAATNPPTYCWISTIQFETRYTVPSVDEESLTRCSHQMQEFRVAEMGSDIPYPANLDFVHDFYQFAKQWTVANSATMAPYQNVGGDPTGAVGDVVHVTLTQKTPYDATALAGVIDAPTCGFLPTPNSPLSDVILPTSFPIVGDTYMVIDLRNQGLTTDSLLTVVCFFSSSKRSAYRLNMRDSLYLTPVDASGREIVDSNGDPIRTLPYTQIRSVIPYVIRSETGAHITTVNQQPGVDAFSVSVAQLHLYMASIGYGFSIPWYGGLPDLPASGGTFVQEGQSGRRLLSISSSGDASNATVSSSTGVSNSTSTNSTGILGGGVVNVVVLLDTNTTMAIYYPDNTTKAEDVVLIVGVILGSMAMGVAGFGIFFALKSVLEPGKALALAKTSGKRKAPTRSSSVSRASERSTRVTRSSAPPSRSPSEKKKRGSTSSYVDIPLDLDDEHLSRSQFRDERDAMLAL